MEMEMNGNSATVDNISNLVVGDNDAGVDEAIREITPVLADNAPPPMASSSGMTAVDDSTSERKQRHHQTWRKNQQQQHQQQMQKNDTLSSVVALSGGSTTDNDNSYCTEIARRVVARGALHLGLEGMEGEALDVLGNVLLGYMEMVSTTISTNVELSGRSSAHVNAYDAINVVANCTAPAATQVTSTASSVRIKGDEASQQQQQQQQQERGWEGLASFLFGPDWFSIPLEGEEVDNTTTHAVNATSSGGGGSITSVSGAAIHANGKSSLQVNGHSPLTPQRPKVGGKMLNSVGKGKELSNIIATGSTTEKGHVTFALDRRNSKGGIVSGDGGVLETNVGDPSLCNIGWNAPYPNTIPAFPLVTNPEVVANPHRWSSGSRILATEIETCRESAATMDNKIQRNNDGPDNNNNNNSKIAQLGDEAADRAMRAALRIPDDVFTKIDTVWGMIDNNSSSSLTNTNQKKISSVATTTTATAASKQTILPITKSNQNITIDTVRPTIRHHSSPYAPNFLPPYPTDHYSDMASTNLAVSMATSAVRDHFLSRMYHTNRGEKRKSSLDPAVTTSSSSSDKRNKISERDIIRRSVIGLGKAVGPKYWGSVNLDDDDDISNNAAGRDMTMILESTISNPGGVSVELSSSSSSSSSSSLSNKKSSQDASQVLPLGRASGSRLSKILEGSMNVS